MPTSVTLTGWKEFEAKCANMPKILESEVGGEVEDAARYWASLAKNAAPVNFGFLRGAISSAKISGLISQTTSGAMYSPYVEWGTGSRAVVPSDLASYAAYWWTHKVHIGIKPKVFFFVQVPLVERQLFGNISRVLKTEH